MGNFGILLVFFTENFKFLYCEAQDAASKAKAAGAKALKLVENSKKISLLHETKMTANIKQALLDVLPPFESEGFFGRKPIAAYSHLKKRSNNLVLGRMFGIENFNGLKG